MNPARKTRPQAPKLPEVTGELRMSSEAPIPSPLPPPGADVDDDQSALGDNDTQAGFIHTSHVPQKCNDHACNQMLLLYFRNTMLKF